MRFKYLDATVRTIVECREKKWAKLVKGFRGPEPSCALCARLPGDECTGCILQLLTGLENCAGTPYWAWEDAAKSWDGTGRTLAGGDSPRAKKHAKREDRMLAAIQKGLEVMQKELAKVK